MRTELHALGKRARDQRRRDDGEHQLVDHVRLLGNGRAVVGIGSEPDPAQKNMLEAADKHAAVAEGQRVAHQRPQNAHQAHHGEALHHGAENVLLAHQAAIKQRQPWPGHQQHQRRRGQHPRVIAGHLRVCRCRLVAFNGLFESGNPFLCCIVRRYDVSESKGGKSQYKKKKQKPSSGAIKHEVFNSRNAAARKVALRCGGFLRRRSG